MLLRAGLTAAIREMAPLLVGRDPREFDRLARLLWRKGSGAGAVAGYLYNAVSGIETALVDLVSKHYGCPAYQLLGGGCGSRSACTAIVTRGQHRKLGADAYRARAGVAARGGRGKGGSRRAVHPGNVSRPRACDGGGRLRRVEVRYRFARLLHGRGVGSPDHDGRDGPDGGLRRRRARGGGAERGRGGRLPWRFAPSEAIRIARRLGEHNLFWLEDPCPPENLRDFADVRGTGACPVLTGENLNRRHGFLDLINSRAVDLVARTCRSAAGCWRRKRIGELAELQGIRVAPHNIASPLGTLASAHVCATLPNFAALEFHGSDVPFWSDLVVRKDAAGRTIPGHLIQGGRIVLHDVPGLGGELDEEVARRYAKPGKRGSPEARILSRAPVRRECREFRGLVNCEHRRTR